MTAPKTDDDVSVDGGSLTYVCASQSNTVAKRSMISLCVS